MKNNLIVIILMLFGTVAFADGYQVGDKAIGFTLKNVDGTMVSTSDYSNAKGFVVIFTCNHCPYSVAYEDRIIALDKKYKERVILSSPSIQMILLFNPRTHLTKWSSGPEKRDSPFPICLMTDKRSILFTEPPVLPTYICSTRRVKT
jgi:hypothetical protein